MSKNEKIIYEPHPVTPERKAELRGQGYKIIDAVFDPNPKAAETGGQNFDRDAAFAYLAEKGVSPAKNLGDKKLAALVAETKAAETEGQE